MTIKERYKDYFKVSVEVNTKTIHSHRDIILNHFNSVTCENEMKYEGVCDNDGKYNFTNADEIVEFAKLNQLEIRGHTLVWHNQTPFWVFEDIKRDGLLDRMKHHIEIMGKHFANDLYCIDVVNEAIDDKSGSIMRTSAWSTIIGEDFMDYAFQYAKKAFPNATLFYNDYNETVPEKRDKIYNKLKELIDRGIPVEGVGMQLHASIYHPNMDEIRQAIECYASLGVRVHITEMDVSLFRFDDKTVLQKPSKELLSKQADVYRDCFQIFREYKDIIDSATLWGIADDETWLSNFPVRNRKNWPLLFDDKHEPKEAYYAIID